MLGSSSSLISLGRRALSLTPIQRPFVSRHCTSHSSFSSFPLSRSLASFNHSTQTLYSTPPSTSTSSRESVVDSSDVDIEQLTATSNIVFPPTPELPLTELNSIETRGGYTSTIGTSSLLGHHHLKGPSTYTLDPIDPISATSEPSGQEIVFEQMTLSDILSAKRRYGTTIHAVRASDRIVAATELMAHMNIGAVLVRDDQNSNRIAGIVSTRDFVQKIQEQGLHPTTSPVSAFMTESPVYAYSDDTALSCLHLMSKHNFRHLPVRQRNKGKQGEERTVGLVSVGDLVRAMLKQYRESNVYLREYIDGKYGQ